MGERLNDNLPITRWIRACRASLNWPKVLKGDIRFDRREALRAAYFQGGELMDTRMPDGFLLREKFETMAELRKRQEELEKKGGVTERILAAVEVQAAIEKLPTDVSSSKYEPHQGVAEMQRRLRKSQG